MSEAEDFEDAVFKSALETSCEELIAEAYKRGYREGIEQAAKVADEEALIRKNQISASDDLSAHMLSLITARQKTAEEIAAAIRALNEGKG